ncbi:MAG: hypothetical protein IT207_02525 [Fimbriimonadaceae bacterium]|nr:hypothetical protein [Fimbriimonadaceae bacterium]
MAFGVKLTDDVAAVDPGSAAPVGVVVTNDADQPDEFELRVDGLDALWVAVPVASFSVEPGGSATERVILRPSRTSENLAGTYPFVVTVRSLKTAEVQTAQGVLEIKPFHSLSIEVQPRRVTLSASHREAEMSAKVVNLGNVAQTVQLFAADADALFAFEFEVDQITIQPGQERVVGVTTAATKNPLFAAARLQNFTVSARNIEHPAVGASTTGQIEHKPLFAPSTAFFFLLLFGLVAAWVLSWPPTPVVDGVTVSPESVTVGEPLTIKWETSGTNSVSLKIGDWAKTRLSPDGTIEFVPDKAGEFPVEITAYSGRRTAKDHTKSVLVKTKAVMPDPELKVSLDKDTVAVGESYILRYECSDAVVKATLFPMQRDLDVRGRSIELQATTPGKIELRVIASNAEGDTVEGAATVTVVEKPEASIVKFDVSPKELEEGGGEVTIEWTVGGASRIEIQYAGKKDVMTELTGTYTATVTQDTAFKLVAYDPKGRTVTSDNVKVTVKKPPPKPDEEPTVIDPPRTTGRG